MKRKDPPPSISTKHQPDAPTSSAKKQPPTPATTPAQSSITLSSPPISPLSLDPALHLCKESDCPIQGNHLKGAYQPYLKRFSQIGGIFGNSNPPSHVTEAYDRIQANEFGANDCAERDIEVVDAFVRYHVDSEMAKPGEAESGSGNKEKIDGDSKK